MTTSPVRAIYAHVPFCHTICGYCDFYSEVLDRRSTGPLVDALVAELEAAAARHDIAARTIFVGGGTPTTLPPAELRRLLTALSRCATGEVEFTVEANPATVTPEIAEALVSCGVNRVSIGAQSFDPAELRVLERIHRPEQVAQTVATCRAAGIDNLNLDLIFAVPGQSADAWRANLDRALALQPDHLSCYGLTFEPGTPLYEQLHAGRVRRVDPDVEARMFELTIDTLAQAGLQQYEISNFARPGRACAHNLTYWSNQPYLGIGPSASGLVDGVRYRNVPDTAAYVRAVSSCGRVRVMEEEPGLETSRRETIMLQLRLVDGLDRAAFRDRFGADITAHCGPAIERFVGTGLLEIDAQRLRLTRAGMLLADSVLTELM